MGDRLNSGDEWHSTDKLFYLSLVSMGLGSVLYSPLLIAGAMGVLTTKALDNRDRSREEREERERYGLNRPTGLDNSSLRWARNRRNVYKREMQTF